ncbi:MAG: hypothetical protein IT168_21825 [Bryobacterales bacterium]|nr:hypothetical protein [Bryobacterales bacterium]
MWVNSVLAAVMAAGLVARPATAAGGSLGVATAEGPFTVNSALVRGNATLTDGAAVETTTAPSRLNLASGAKVRLDPNSRARVFTDRVVLEKGSGELTATRTYSIEARTLRITPEAPNSSARVALRADKVVQVASSSGRFRVHNAAGILVSNLDPGLALEFEPQVTGPGAPSSFVGCVLKKDDKFIVYDQTTRMIVELRGTGFEKEAGNRVQVNGTARAAAQGNTQALDVTSVIRIEQGGCADVAKEIGADTGTGGAKATAASKPARTPKSSPAPASTPAGSAGSTGMSAGTKIAIIGAVAGGGVAAAVVATQSGSDRSR